MPQMNPRKEVCSRRDSVCTPLQTDATASTAVHGFPSPARHLSVQGLFHAICYAGPKTSVLWADTADRAAKWVVLSGTGPSWTVCWTGARHPIPKLRLRQVMRISDWVCGECRLWRWTRGAGEGGRPCPPSHYPRAAGPHWRACRSCCICTCQRYQSTGDYLPFPSSAWHGVLSPGMVCCHLHGMVCMGAGVSGLKSMG